MAGITGLGGVFLQIDGATRALLDWYHDILGVSVGRYGIGLECASVPVLISFDGHPDGALLNYTVDDLGGYLDVLRERNVRVVQEIADYDYGRFAQIEDPLGNRIELWEPYVDAYRAMAAGEVAAYEVERAGEVDGDV